MHENTDLKNRQEKRTITNEKTISNRSKSNKKKRKITI